MFRTSFKQFSSIFRMVFEQFSSSFRTGFAQLRVVFERFSSSFELFSNLFRTVPEKISYIFRSVSEHVVCTCTLKTWEPWNRNQTNSAAIGHAMSFHCIDEYMWWERAIGGGSKKKAATNRFVMARNLWGTEAMVLFFFVGFVCSDAQIFTTNNEL